MLPLDAPATLIAAFLVGLFGSIHCVGMCGGIVGALTLRLPQKARSSQRRLLPYVLSYNLGRITSYAIAGALAGVLGAQVLVIVPLDHAQLLGRWISAIFMIALGLYIAGWPHGLADLEKLGARLWRLIEPLGRRCLPVKALHQALVLGFVWGWLPCGLVYAALAWSFAAGSASQGAALMLAFGAGTLPMLFALGAASHWLGKLFRSTRLRRAVGAMVLLLGVFAVVMPALDQHEKHVSVEHKYIASRLTETPRAL